MNRGNSFNSRRNSSNSSGRGMTALMKQDTTTNIKRIESSEERDSREEEKSLNDSSGIVMR